MPDTFAPGVVPPAQTGGPALWFIFQGNRLLTGIESKLLPVCADPGQLGLASSRRHYLGDLEGVACWTAEVAAEATPPEGMAFHGLRSLFRGLDEVRFAVAGRAVQILEWDRAHRFCGACGSTTELHRSERARVCPACERVSYPRLSPAIMVLIRRGGELLLARSPHFVPGMYSALAGFVEPGETLEEAVRREVAEEVGLTVSGITYFGSQPWPFPHSLMIAFTAESASGDIRIAPEEIEDAAWFPLDRLPLLPDSVSIARQLIDATVDAMSR